MKKYNIKEEYQKMSTVKAFLKIMDEVFEKVKNKQ